MTMIPRLVHWSSFGPDLSLRFDPSPNWTDPISEPLDCVFFGFQTDSVFSTNEQPYSLTNKDLKKRSLKLLKMNLLINKKIQIEF